MNFREVDRDINKTLTIAYSIIIYYCIFCLQVIIGTGKLNFTLGTLVFTSDIWSGAWPVVAGVLGIAALVLGILAAVIIHYVPRRKNWWPFFGWFLNLWFLLLKSDYLLCCYMLFRWFSWYVFVFCNKWSKNEKNNKVMFHTDG